MNKKTSYLFGMLWSSGGNIMGLIASFVTTMVFVRILSKEEVGAFFLIMMVAQLAASLGDFGLRNTAIRFLSEPIDHDESETLSRYFWTISCLLSFVSIGVLAAILPFLNKLWPSKQFVSVAWYCIPITFFQINFQMGLSILIGKRKFRALSISSFLVEIIRMLASVTALLLGYGLNGLLLSMVFSRAILLGAIWRMIPSSMVPLIRHKRGREFLVFGGWLQGNSIMSLVTFRMVDGLLATFSGTAALAVYSTAFQIPSALQRCIESIRPVLLGYISSVAQGLREHLVDELRVFIGLLSICTAFFMVFAKPLILLIFSDRYEESIRIMQVLSFWITVGVTNYILVITLIGKGKSREVLFQAIPQFFVMLGSCVVLMPLYQGMGAASSLAITSVVGSLTSCWMLGEGNRWLFMRLCWVFVKPAFVLFILLIFVLKTPLYSLHLLAFPVTIALFYLLRVVSIRDCLALTKQIEK